jgi:hypothetical protein
MGRGEHEVRPYDGLDTAGLSLFPQFLAAFLPVPLTPFFRSYHTVCDVLRSGALRKIIFFLTNSENRNIILL